MVRLRRLVGLLLATCVAAPVPFLATAPAQARQAPRPDRTVRIEADRVDRVPTPRPSWWDCGELYATGAQCATVALPLDYDRPLGPTTQVAVLRIRATDPARRIGTLFVNPGGPGGSGVELAAAARDFLDPRVLARFDVVGFDPRGTNLSSGVRCWPTMPARDRALAGAGAAFPRGAVQDAAAVGSARAFGTACSTTGRPLAASVSTAEVARDMDVLRRAVGDARLTYLGFSYGTYLGQVYANLFPDRVRAIALDGVLDPLAWAGTKATRNTPQTTRIGSAKASARALDRILGSCRTAGPAYCSLAATGDPKAIYASLMTSLRAAPIVVRGPDFEERFTYADVTSILVDMLYSPFGSYDVDAFLSLLVELRGPTTPARAKAARAGLHRIAVRYRDFGRTGAPSPRVRAAWRRAGRTALPAYENGIDAYQAVMCTDGLNPSLVARWPVYAARADRAVPGFGPLWTWPSAPCARATWTARDEDAYRGPFTRRTASPVLVVGNLWDPATPYEGAVRVARLLPNSRLLTGVSWGHTAYGSSPCIDRAVTTYLLRQGLPPVGKRCRGLDQPYTEPLTPFTSLTTGRAPARAPLPSGAAPAGRPGRAPVSPLVP